MEKALENQSLFLFGGWHRLPACIGFAFESFSEARGGIVILGGRGSCRTKAKLGRRLAPRTPIGTIGRYFSLCRSLYAGRKPTPLP